MIDDLLGAVVWFPGGGYMQIYEQSGQVMSALIVELHEWWQSLADGQVPDRSQLDPNDLKKFLPNLLIADVEPDPFRIRYRLVGTRVVEASGIDFTGKYFDEMQPPSSGELSIEEFRISCREQRPVFGRCGVMTRKKAFYWYEFAILPLRKGGADIAQVLSIEDYPDLKQVKMDLPPWALAGSAGAPMTP